MKFKCSLPIESRPHEISTRSPRSRKAESLPEAHNYYSKNYRNVAKSEMGDHMSRIPISNITHRRSAPKHGHKIYFLDSFLSPNSKSRNRGDQSSGRRSKSSASSRVSKSGETRQKSSVQKVYPPVTNPTKP